MKERSIERIPAELEEWIRDGKRVRTDSSQPFAGMCGGLVARSNGSENGGAWCQRGAGMGTDHPGYGRCWHHEEQLGEENGALAPWVGDLTDEEWIALCGATSPGGAERHGAKVLETLYKTWEQWLQEALPPEEWFAYKTMPTDPIALLDQAIKLNRLQMARIHRWMRQETMKHNMNPVTVGGTPRSLEISQAESRLQGLDMVFARLMETRARISEAATAAKAEGVWEDLVRGMSDQEFLEMSANPDSFVRLLNRGGSSARGIGEPGEN